MSDKSVEYRDGIYWYTEAMKAQQELAEARQLNADLKAADDANWASLRRIAADKRAAEAALADTDADNDNLRLTLARVMAERDAAKAALAEAVKGLKTIRDYKTFTSPFPALAADTLGRVEALKVQPEVAKR